MGFVSFLCWQAKAEASQAESKLGILVPHAPGKYLCLSGALHQCLVRHFPELHQLVPTLFALWVETGVLITSSTGKVRQPTVESRNSDRKYPEHLEADVNHGERR